MHENENKFDKAKIPSSENNYTYTPMFIFTQTCVNLPLLIWDKVKIFLAVTFIHVDLQIEQTVQY